MSRADQRVLRSFGHVERMDEYRMTRRVLMAEVSGERVLGRHRLGWIDGVKVALGNRGMTLLAAISVLSDLLYSLTPFLFQLYYAPLHSTLYPFATLQPNFSNTSSQERSLSFSQHFSYPMPLLHRMPLVQLLLL